MSRLELIGFSKSLFLSKMRLYIISITIHINKVIIEFCNSFAISLNPFLCWVFCWKNISVSLQVEVHQTREVHWYLITIFQFVIASLTTWVVILHSLVFYASSLEVLSFCCPSALFNPSKCSFHRSAPFLFIPPLPFSTTAHSRFFLSSMKVVFHLPFISYFGLLFWLHLSGVFLLLYNVE